MPTVISHGIIAAAAAKTVFESRFGSRLLWLSICCSILPDVDFLAFSFGIPYGHLFGHRGFTHSLCFAILSSVLVVSLFFRSYSNRSGLLLYFWLITASHGFLDAMTDGGLGVAFFSPFVTTRYFLPFRPLKVSPIGLDFFFSDNSRAVLLNELLWLIVPSCVVITLSELYRRRR